MVKVSTVATFQYDIKKVWNLVTNLENYTWRSDLNQIEIVNQRQFIEHTKEGYDTKFTITASEYCKRWEFDMANNNMIGHWTGIFSENGAETSIDFTEEVTTKKFLMQPFVKGYLKKQQVRYLEDLKKALAIYEK